MTVAELIKVLEECPNKDIPVTLYTFDGECETICEANYWGRTASDFTIGYENKDEEGFIPS